MNTLIALLVLVLLVAAIGVALAHLVSVDGLDRRSAPRSHHADLFDPRLHV